MGWVRVVRLACVHLGHTSNTSASQPGVLVAISPAVDSSLDQAALAAQGRVQLGECPAHRVALGLVLQAVASVLVLGAARAGVDTVLCLELCRELVGIHRLDIASNGVLHLDAIPRILESNPLDAVAVLSDHQGGCCRDGPGSGVGVDARRGACWGRELAPILGAWGGSSNGCGLGRSLELGGNLVRLNLLVPGTARHASLRMLVGMLSDLVLLRRVRHHHTGLRLHGLVRWLGMLRVGRRRGLLWHGSVLGLLGVVHGLLVWEWLLRMLAVDVPLWIMARW